MDHNNKHLLPGFQFPAAFAGLANAGTNLEASFLSALSQFSTLPATILPTTLNPADLAQYVAAAQHSNQQAWLVDQVNQAKVAAMLPSLYLSSVADVKNFQLAQQSLQASVVNGSSSSNIFPNLIASKLTAAKYLSQSKPEEAESPINVQPLSNASSSHQSTSTPHEIDVGSTIHTPQALAFDLSTKNSPAVAKINDADVVCEPSTSTSSILPNVLDSSRVMSNAELEAIDPTELLIFDKKAPQPKEVQRSKSECVISTSLPAPVTGPPPPSAPPTKRFAQQANDEETDEHDVTQELFTHFPAQEAEDAGLFGVFGETVADGGLSPVQFTPPDSPTAFLKEEPESLRPTPSSTPFLPAPAPTPAPMASPQKLSTSFDSPPKSMSIDPFKAPIAALKPPKKTFAERMAAKSNKVPIYKQKRLANYRMDNGTPIDAKDDAYSFEDEDEHSLTKLDIKEQLDQEVKEKLSKLAGQSADRNKNVYVPGVGFAVPQEQPQQDLWRNVLLKKRPVENRPAIPSANLLPASVHAEACQAAARLAEPEIVTLAESLRRRKRARFVCNFIKTEALPSTDSTCFKQEGSEYKYSEKINHSLDPAPKLPKLIIKLPRKSTDECVDKKRKKKKRKHEEDDSDWEDDRRPKKHKHKKNKERRDSEYELRLIEQEDYDDGVKQEVPDLPPVKEEPQQEVVVNPKKRFIQQWHEQAKQESGQPKYNGVEGIKPPIRKPFPEFNTEAIKQRLNKFSQADGNITKGCFVVNKSELFRDDCALWKVDNPNMLQKYPPRVDPTTKNVTYKNSSTYSGWCEQISSGYYKVAVKFIKQSRSESIVEPEVPLADLFPAMTSELIDNNALIVPEDETKHDPNEGRNLLLDQRRMSLYILYREVIDHALTLEHLQLIKEKNDWNYLKAYTDIEKINIECMSKLRSSINEDMEHIIQDYTRLIVTETQKGASGFISLLCQSCKSEKKQVEKVVQLLGRQGYDRETFQYADKLRTRPREEDEEELEPLIATEFYFCEPCATAAQQFHRCYHMMFDLFRFAEDKLESLGTIHSEYKPETIVEIAKKSRTWQNKHFSDIIEMWKKIETVNVNSSVPT